MIAPSMNFLTLAAIASIAVLSSTPTEAKLSKGLAWGANNNWAKKIAKGQISWYHHWQNAAVPEMPRDVEYVPMDWGPKYHNLWQQRKAGFAKHKPKYVLAFNEPDVTGQSDMSPSSAASRYMKELEPLRKKGIKVSSPQIVWNTKWMDSFLKKIRAQGGDVDFIAAHYYGSWKDQKRLESWIKTLRSKYKKSIWLTEYGVTASSGGSTAQIMNFKTKVTNWMSGKSYVKRVAWLGCFATNNPPDSFASNRNGMFTASGSLNKMGISYVYKRDVEEKSSPMARSTPGAKRHHIQHHKRIISNGIHQVADLARRNGTESTINGYPASEEEINALEAQDAEDETEDPNAIHCDEICKLRDEQIAEAAANGLDDDEDGDDYEDDV